MTIDDSARMDPSRPGISNVTLCASMECDTQPGTVHAIGCRVIAGLPRCGCCQSAMLEGAKHPAPLCLHCYREAAKWHDANPDQVAVYCARRAKGLQ